VVQDEVDAGARDEGGEAGDELGRGEVEVGGPVAPAVTEGNAGDVAGTELEAVLGNGGAAEVAAKALEGVAVGGVDGDGGVQVEAFEVSVQAAVARLGARNERVPEARDEAARIGAEGADGGLLQGGERRSFVGLVVEGIGEEAAAIEQAGDAAGNGEQELGDVGGGRELDEGRPCRSKRLERRRRRGAGCGSGRLTEGRCRSVG
jgi:hypothetical protein